MTEVESSSQKALLSKEEQVKQLQSWLDEHQARHNAVVMELEAAKSRVVTLESELRANKDALRGAHENVVIKVWWSCPSDSHVLGLRTEC